MVYFPCKRLIAHILLLSQLLTSCGKPIYLHMGGVRPCRTSSATSIPSTLCKVSCAAPRPIPLPQGAMLHFHQKGSSCWAELRSGSNQPVNLPVRFLDGFTTESLARSDVTWQQQYIHLHPALSDSLEPSFVYIGESNASSPTQEDPLLETASLPRLASVTTPSLEIAPCSYTFIKSPGYRIVVEPDGDRWKAMVHDNRFPGLSRSYAASVALEKGYCLESLITKDSAHQSSHIHLISTNKNSPMVYIGSFGLKGGGLFNWFGCERCTMFGCFEQVWRCVCGYKCSDDSCWEHCTKHYQSHRCAGCHTVTRCPRFYKCQTCHSTTYCSNCCGCYERQRQEQIRLRERARRAAAQRAEEEEEERRQQWVRDQWAREREQEQEQIRAQKERERQAWLSAQAERERQEWIRQQQERERQAVLSKLEASLASAPITQTNISNLNTSVINVGISNQTDQEEAYAFVHQGSIVQDWHGAASYSDQDSDSDNDVLFLLRCTSSDSILSLYDTNDIRHNSTDQASDLPHEPLFEKKVPTRCSSNASFFSLDDGVPKGNDSTDTSFDLLDDTPFEPAVASTRCILNDPLPLLKRSSSNASISSLESLHSTASDSNSSDANTTTHQHTDDQIAILAPSTSTNLYVHAATVDEASSSDPSLVQSFLAHYTIHLSSEEQAYFYQSAGKFIEEKLPQIEVTTQQEIIDYFTHEGLVYPYVVQHYHPLEWISQSLLKEVVAYPNENQLFLNSFRTQWLKITETYPIGDQVSLLKSLRIKKLTHNLSLLDISNMLDLVLHTGASGYGIVCSQDNNWLFDLNTAWLQPKLASLTNFSASERHTLGAALADMDWNTIMMQLLVESIQDEVTLDPVLELLAAIKTYHVPDSLVRSTLMTLPAHAARSKAKQWAHTIVYHSLLHKVRELSPEIAQAIDKPLYNLLQSNCSANLLESVITDHLALIEAHTADFVKVLELLHNYQVTDAICASAFSILPEVAASDWVDKVDQVVVSNLFKSIPQKYTTDELIQHIAASSSAFTPEELRASYDAVMQSYHAPSVVLQSVNDSAIHKFKNKPIADWNEKAVTLWAKQVKSSNRSIAQSELIAVVQRAVKLHHGFSPRDTQLLSLLTLLNPTEGMGRLAQINTGEGKSLIVAMLAAIRALQGKKVDVVTTSTELSIPEVKKQAPFFKSLALSVAENSNIAIKPLAYKSDVVYGITGDFQADILRTEFLGKDIRGNRGFGIVIVDEVDSMLFDNRSHSVRLSEQTPGMTHLELPLAAIWEYHA